MPELQLLVLAGLQAAQAPSRWAVLTRVDLSVIVVRGLQVFGVLLLAYLGFRLVNVLARRIEAAVDDGDPTTVTEREQRGRTLAQLLTSVGGVTITVGASLTILGFFFNIGPLLAGVGVAGLAISFGAQSLVKDVISGFFMLLENQLAVGDIVDINGVGGVVERLSMRVVMLRDVNGTLHIIPNGSITMVSNRTRGWSRAVLDIGVGYQEEVDRAIRALREVAREFWNDPAWAPRLMESPQVWGLEAMSETKMDLRLVATTRPGMQFDVARELRRRVKQRFDQDNILAPFPERRIQLVNDEPATEMLWERAGLAVSNRELGSAESATPEPTVPVSKRSAK